MFADLNGDGLQDAIQYDITNTDQNIYVWFNSGNGFFPSQVANIRVPGGITTYQLDRYAIRVFDFNDDGRQDLLLRPRFLSTSGTSSPIVLMFNQEDGTFTAQTLTDISETFDPTDPAQSMLIDMFEVTDINGDGLGDIIMKRTDGVHVYLRGRAAQQHRLLKTVRRHGISRTTYAPGVRYDFTYKPITDSSVYTPDATSCRYPQKCQNGGIWVVSQLTRREDGLGTAQFPVSNTYNYQYAHAHVDLRGRGFLGFEQFIKHDVERKADYTLNYNLAAAASPDGNPSFYPFIGQPISEEVDTNVTPPGATTAQFKSNTVVKTHTLSTVQTTGAGSFFAYPSRTVDHEYDTDVVGSHDVHSWTTTRSIDANGNATLTQISREDGSLDSVQHTITYDTTIPADWPRVSQSIDSETSGTVIGSGLSSLTRTTTLTFDSNWRLQSSVALASTAERDRGEQMLNVTYSYSTEGLVSNVVMSESTARGGASRSAIFQYDGNEHMLPVAVTNSLGQHRRYAYHPGLGVLAVEEDESGLQTVYHYDGFGRIRHRLAPSGEELDWSYAVSSSDPDGFANSDTLVRVRRQQTGGAKVLTEYNWLQKPTVRREFDRIDGKAVFENYSYDAQDRLIQRTGPNFSPSLSPVATFQWDSLNRITAETRIDGSQWVYSFDGLQIAETDGRGNQKSYNLDGQRRLANVVEQVQDLNGTIRNVTTSYVYGPFGSAYQTTDSQGNHWISQVNRLGLPYHILDPDAGERWFYMNAFGDVETETTPNKTLQYSYDANGRPATEVSGARTKTYTWDTSSIGRIASISSFDGVTTAFSYDSVGRLSAKTWQIGAEQFAMSYSYLPDGRTDKIFYPLVAGAVSSFGVKLGYGQYGALQSVADAASGAPYWTLTGSTATGFTTESFGSNAVTATESERSTRPGRLGELQITGNNTSPSTTLHDATYDYDGNGNVISRIDKIRQATESFQYDFMNRLIHWTWSTTSAVQEQRFDYDDIGNLTLKKILQGAGSDIQFTVNPALAGPHGIVSSSFGSYSYDGNGNQRSAPGRTTMYNESDLPATISQGGVTYSFSYDGLDRRVLKQKSNGDSVVRIDNLYERRIEGGATTHLYSIFALGKHVAVVKQAPTPSLPQTLFIHGGHTGSTELITDSSGALIDTIKYEPFGQRTGLLPPLQSAPAPTSGIRTGFTEQEHDEDLGLIDMKGRIYDPVQSRFVSVDPIISTRRTGQELNGYSYVRNNPLTWRDRNGWFSDEDAPVAEGVAPHA